MDIDGVMRSKSRAGTGLPSSRANEARASARTTHSAPAASRELSISPFRSPARPAVFVSGGEGGYRNTRRALSNIDLSPAKGKRVILKPNAGRIAPRRGGVTVDPDVVAAAVDAFLEAGAEVAVGESPIVSVSTMEAFEQAGIADVARERGCRLIDMDEREYVPVSLPEGIAITNLKVCPEVLEYDIIVSIPVMKMHMHTGVSLAVKNMKGCLWRRSKVDLHMLPPAKGSEEKSLDIAIADMSGVLRPHLAIIDGTTGMEGLGPSAGKAKPANIIVVSADAFAADAVACRLMGTKADDIPHLRMGAERGYGVIDVGRITVRPDNWEDFVSPFEPPPSDLAVEFPQITILDENSCSACQSTLFLFLRRYGEKIFEYFPPDTRPRIAIGKGHESLEPGTLCVGNCTAKHKKDGIFVPGCPPVASEILNALSTEERRNKA